MLVGDKPFFGPLGFSVAPGRDVMPGPVDPRRVLARALVDGAVDGLEGQVAARLERSARFVLPTWHGRGGDGGLERVTAAAKQAPGRGLPPVHLWNPAHCGEIDIVIKKDGLWFHEGTPIGREALVRLFSTVLRKDPDGFHLVTPVEKMRITVEDAPFVAVRVDAEWARR